MVSEPDLVRGRRFKPPLFNLFGLFDSPPTGMGLHVRGGVKGVIFILKLKSYKLELLGELVV